MKFFYRLLFSACGLVLLIVCLANQEIVIFNIIPLETEFLFLKPFSFELPLFFVIIFFIFLGVLIGALGEWFREKKYRRIAKLERKEAKAVKNQLVLAVKENKQEKDDVLALLKD